MEMRGEEKVCLRAGAGVLQVRTGRTKKKIQIKINTHFSDVDEKCDGVEIK